MKSDFIPNVSKSVVPLPPDLVSLPTIEAEPWIQVDTSSTVTCEGPSFDQQGNLFVTLIGDGRIVKITPRKQVTAVLENKKIKPDGSAFHKDGRLFVVCLTGELITIDPDGKATYMKPTYQGKQLTMNDLVFDSKGNLFVTDFIGTVPNPTGGVYRFSPDFTKVQLVLEHLASPNGISLSPEGNALWLGESARNAIVRIQLLQDGVTVDPSALGVCYAYYSTGAPGVPDSNKVDVEGNLYQCIMGQGRVIVLNANGIPIANVVVPGRDEGKNLRTTNLAFRPGTSEAFVTAGGKQGAWIFKFEGLAKGLRLFAESPAGM